MRGVWLSKRASRRNCGLADTGKARPDGSRVSTDAWLGGKLVLTQPTSGHRIGTDAALLAAALDIKAGRVIDVGAGVGAVGLAVALRSPGVTVDLVEKDPTLAAIAADNAVANGLGQRARALALDILVPSARRASGLTDGFADVVLTNPPFFEPGAVRVSPDAAKARAHVFSVSEDDNGLAAWLRASLALLAPGGQFAIIHRPDALAAILSGLGERLGGVALMPIYARAEGAAIRILVSGIKGSRGAFFIAPGLVLHREDGRLTPAAEAIHRGDGLIDWSRPLSKKKKADRLGGDPPIR